MYYFGLRRRFFEDLDPTYGEEILNLVERLEEIFLKEHGSGRKIIIRTFHDKPDKFDLAMECEYKLCQFYNFEKKSLKIPSLPIQKLYYAAYNSPIRREKFCVGDISYPYEELKNRWREYESREAEEFIPKAVQRQYKKMQMLYLKIVAAEDNTEEWFQALMEAENYQFVVDNVEFRLNKDLKNKELWKLFLQYLENNHQHKKLLETYSKYCRFFLDDFEMLEQYQKSAETFGPSFVAWKNPKPFEVYDENILKYNAPKVVIAAPAHISAMTASTDTVSRPSCYFNSETALPQKFPFRFNLMDYIIKNANASVLFHLFKSCKLL
uniref:RGS domain-containing protein n=1 Tax=Panagrolaimus sp. ES5 TaxID=591445 RepID=A0AC34FPA9_9BILA